MSEPIQKGRDYNNLIRRTISIEEQEWIDEVLNEKPQAPNDNAPMLLYTMTIGHVTPYRCQIFYDSCTRYEPSR